MAQATRALLSFLFGATLVSVLIFLLASDFFTSWDGSIASVKPGRSDAASRLTVLIVTEDRTLQRSWPGDLVRSLVLPEDPFAVRPFVVDPSRPETTKSRYTLHALVRRKGPEATWEIVATTSPQSFGLALVVLGLLVAGRNMAVSGVPWRTTPAPRYRPEKLVPPGQTAPVQRGSASKRGPPPSKPQVGRGRR